MKNVRDGSTAKIEDVMPAQLLSPHKVPPFPLQTLPETLRSYVERSAKLLGVPPDFIIVPAFSMFGKLIGCRLLYQPMTLNNKLQVYPTLWTALVGKPGKNKSGVLHDVLKPLFEEEKRLSGEFKKGLAESEMSFEAWMKAKKAGSDSSLPRRKRAIVRSVTIEALLLILKDNPQGIALIVDELAQMLTGIGQYKGGSGEDRSVWLTIWSNGRISQDRISRASVEVERPFVNIIGTIQPAAIQKHLLDTSEDGLAPRFQLMIYPEPYEGNMINATLDKTIENVLQKLADGIKGGIFGELYEESESDEAVDTYLLRSCAEASQAFVDFSNKMKKFAESQPEPALESHFAKYPILCARLAMVLHCTKLVEENGLKPLVSDEPVSLAIMQAAISLCEDYFIPHALKVYSLMGVTTQETKAVKIARHLIAHSDIKNFTAREIRRKNLAGLKNPTEVIAAIEHLVISGWLFKTDTKGVGRHTVKYIVNPRIHQNSNMEATQSEVASKSLDDEMAGSITYPPETDMANKKGMAIGEDLELEDSSYMEQARRAIRTRRENNIDKKI